MLTLDYRFTSPLFPPHLWAPFPSSRKLSIEKQMDGSGCALYFMGGVKLNKPCNGEFCTSSVFSNISSDEEQRTVASLNSVSSRDQSPKWGCLSDGPLSLFSPPQCGPKTRRTLQYEAAYKWDGPCILLFHIQYIQQQSNRIIVKQAHRPVWS